jgi:hypothetical protein
MMYNHSNYECPPSELYIESHIVEGFEISKGGIDLIEEWVLREYTYSKTELR